jgi:hypothetical protein
MTEIKVGLPSHSTEVDTTSSWDNGANERRVKSPSTRAYYRRIYGWLDNDADETRKSSYRFIHHMISADGTPGAANFRALAAGIAALNGSRRGTVLDDAGRNAVHRHLAAHYEDAGRQAPPLLGKSEMDDIFNSMEVKSEDITLGSQVVVTIGGEEIFGTVVESEEGNLFIREWTLEEDSWLPTDEISDFSSELVQAKEFIYIGDFPDDDDDDYEDEEEDTDNMATIKLEDIEMTEQDFEILVKSIAKLVIAEIGVKVDPVEAVDQPVAEDEVAESVEETVAVVEGEEDAAEAEDAEEAKSDQIEEVKSDNVEESAEVSEEAPAEEATEEEAHGCGEGCGCEKADVAGEKAIALTYEDLKEFSDLIKML